MLVVLDGQYGVRHFARAGMRPASGLQPEWGAKPRRFSSRASSRRSFDPPGTTNPGYLELVFPGGVLDQASNSVIPLNCGVIQIFRCLPLCPPCSAGQTNPCWCASGTGE
jgi:hypothetical protein